MKTSGKKDEKRGTAIKEAGHRCCGGPITKILYKQAWKIHRKLKFCGFRTSQTLFEERNLFVKLGYSLALKLL